MNHISWSRCAMKDLQKIAEFIRLYNVDREYEVTALLIASADQLRRQPHSRQKRETMPDGSELRSPLVSKKYRLVYKVTLADDVGILQVLDLRSNQDLYR
ncbi:MAG: type II toxin-antitoxin system RelE/ParE family toxin [Cytophagaceae bacterium]|nr:MAG: type II toxin-antitoxin system RelE/ParE family toxin [Cytophagaceae bacterium]